MFVWSSFGFPVVLLLSKIKGPFRPPVVFPPCVLTKVRVPARTVLCSGTAAVEQLQFPEQLQFTPRFCTQEIFWLLPWNPAKLSMAVDDDEDEEDWHPSSVIMVA